ncbi:MAG TPA: Uma2 family endonuclease [Bryobacteraceae bacterium]
MATTATMSGAAFDQLPYEEGRRWELLQGELIDLPGATMEHQVIVTRLILSLGNYFDREANGGAVPDVEFALGEADRLRPDVAVLLGERWTTVDRKKTPIPVAPDIAVEVLSPSERFNDSLRKTRTYLATGVQEVWQVAAATQEILIHRGSKSIAVLEVGDRLETPLLPDWGLDVREVFQP